MCFRQAEGDLVGVDVVDAEAAWLAAVGCDVRARAEVTLRQGMTSLSQAEVGSALQVYYNLSELQPAVRDLQARSSPAQELGQVKRRASA